VRKKISVVTPCFNEEDGIEECVLAVRALFENKLPEYDYEHLLIDNQSTDRTVSILRQLANTDNRIKVIVNSRNFGLARSPYHAFLEAGGDAVVPIVADLQTPLDVIPKMIREWESGVMLVFGARRETKVGRLTRVFRSLYYGMMKVVGATDQVPHFIGFGLFDRKIVSIIKNLGDTVPYVRGTLTEVGFRRSVVEYDEPRRKHGFSRHSFFDKFELASLGLTVSSPRPIYLVIILGFLTAFASLVAALVYLLLKLLLWNDFSLGLAPLLILCSFIGAVQLVSVGLIGLYVEVILRHVRPRPLVIEEERINFD